MTIVEQPDVTPRANPPITPRANPPITIGPFTNVPAPGSPIRSDWPQQLTQYVVDRFAQFPTKIRGGNTVVTTDGAAEAWITYPGGLAAVGSVVITDSSPAPGFGPIFLKMQGIDNNNNRFLVKVYTSAGAPGTNVSNVGVHWQVTGS